ncbi:hypothetical protein ILUMI_23082 [Ignelater luminosus]|uniref:TFIID subunit TAF5 NTD2 domain-containing protein n=1 Tax=Ignelater luminosus TaxID=2038154 RepID=A0A8K0CFX3_IGNLU|nr:hypothetical protein ILUMI_23082 [Ignelater luminosus]
MDELKRENSTNKARRSRSDHVKQVVLSYLHKRNYPVLSPNLVPVQDFVLSSFIENEISRPNSILYSCFNNDPVIIDHTFSKFITWLKESLKAKSNYEDLELLVGPLFCHIYLEILRGGHTERATNFFKLHLPSVDRSKCDNLVKELINAFANDSIELPSLKDNFRSNKYVVQLSTGSVNILKKFLAEAGHVVLLQVFQNWFTIEEKQVEIDQLESEEVENINVVEDSFENMFARENEILCNGHGPLRKEANLSIQKLVDAIEAVKREPPSIYSVNIANVKDEVTCGTLNRKTGVCAYSYNNAVVLRSLKTLQELNNTNDYGEVVLLGHSGRVYDIAFINNYKCLISASQDKTIRLYDLESYSPKTVYKGHEYPIYCLAASNVGGYFVSGSYDHSARLWSVCHKETLRIFAGLTQEVTSIDFHPNCTYIAAGSADKTIRMWSIKDAEPLRLFLGSKGAIYSLAFSPKGQYLATAGEDKRLRIWDLISAKQLVEIKTGTQPVIKLAISSDETTIATGSIDGTLKTWDFTALTKSTEETNTIDPIINIALTPKLLSLDYCFDTYGCLTSQYSASVTAGL